MTVVRVATVVAEMALRRLVTKVTEITKKCKAKNLNNICDEQVFAMKKELCLKKHL